MKLAETVTVKEIGDILRISKQAVTKRAKKENWLHEIGSNRMMAFQVRSLPSDVQKAIVAEKDVAPDLLPVLSPEAALEAAKKLTGDLPVSLGAYPLNKDSWTPETAISQEVIRDPKVTKWTRIIQEAQNVPKGWKRRAWVEAVAVKHDTTFQTVYRKITSYEKKGLAGLHHTKSNRNQPKSWTPEAVDWWVGLVLKREHRKLGKNVLYAILQEEARKRGWDIGEYRSALWWLKQKTNPQLYALQRGGLRALDNTLPPVLRDYSDLAPFEILVGDQHRFDFWVMDEETGAIFRPEGYFWQDLRTRCFYGGALDRKYDSYLMGLALRMGLRVFGAFGSIYTDWGKPETGQYMMGVMKDMRNLGLFVEREVDVPLDIDPGTEAEDINPCAIMPGTHKKAIVRNAKAKMIEGTFGNLERILRDVFMVPGYVKRLGAGQEENEIDEKEKERLAQRGRLLTFWEFAEKVLKAMDYYNREKGHRGVLKEWAWRPKPRTATPFDCLKACNLQGWKPVYLSPEAVDLIFLPRAQRIVDRGRVTFENDIYEHQALVEIEGKVELRFDPMEPNWLLVFKDGRFLCQARPVEYSSMKDRTLAQRKIEEKRRIRKGFILEYRRLTSAIPDFREYSETPAIERAAALVTREQRAQFQELKDRFRERTPEELAAEVKKIEEYKPKANRPIFRNEVDRYQWCLEQQELEAADSAFLSEYEARMDEDTRAYWQIYKEAQGERRTA